MNLSSLFSLNNRLLDAVCIPTNWESTPYGYVQTSLHMFVTSFLSRVCMTAECAHVCRVAQETFALRTSCYVEVVSARDSLPRTKCQRQRGTGKIRTLPAASYFVLGAPRGMNTFGEGQAGTQFFFCAPPEFLGRRDRPFLSRLPTFPSEESQR